MDYGLRVGSTRHLEPPPQARTAYLCGYRPSRRVYRIDRSGRSTVLWTAGQPKASPSRWTKGTVYAASSPDGEVYRIENGQATEYLRPIPRDTGPSPVAAMAPSIAGPAPRVRSSA